MQRVFLCIIKEGSMKYILISFIFSFITTQTLAASYKKATEGKDVVLDKLYPKKGKIEINPSFGAILNQSYMQSFLAGGNIVYFWKEGSGFSVDFQLALNSDKAERTCIESFYLDPKNAIPEVCGPPELIEDTDGEKFPRYGPAYVPIREMKYLISGNYVWNPVYGKQLLFLSATSYFDLFFELGGGVMMSDFYPERNVLNNGNEPRAPYYTDEPERNVNVGALVDDVDSYGIFGRPLPVTENKSNDQLRCRSENSFWKILPRYGNTEEYDTFHDITGF